MLIATLVLGLLAIFVRDWTGGILIVVALLTLLGLAPCLSYSAKAKQSVRDKRVGVPCNFSATSKAGASC